MSLPSWVFGRDPGCDVRIADDPYVSPRHAKVTLRPFVEDLGSTNGTRIERGGLMVPVRGPVELRPGDKLWIGRTAVPWEAP